MRLAAALGGSVLLVTYIWFAAAFFKPWADVTFHDCQIMRFQGDNMTLHGACPDGKFTIIYTRPVETR